MIFYHVNRFLGKDVAKKKSIKKPKKLTDAEALKVLEKLLAESKE